MRLRVGVLTAIIISLPISISADESEPRRMFVEAELLRRAEVCEVGKAGNDLKPLAQILAWSFIEHHEKARQLKPLLPALGSLEQLGPDQRDKLVNCLENWREAARVEQRILEQHPGSDAAFELARERRLTPADMTNIIARVKTTTAAATASDVDRAKEAYRKLSRPPAEKLTASQIDAIRQQLASCWSPPVGARDAEDLRIEIWVRLERDGTVRDAELITRERMNESFYRATAESAMRAVRICSPIEGLPSKKYEQWRTLLLNFDAQEMLGE